MEDMKKCVDCGSRMAGEYISPDEKLCCFCYEGYEMEASRQEEWERKMTVNSDDEYLNDVNEEVDAWNYKEGDELPF